jgi:hypothetical protein
MNWNGDKAHRGLDRLFSISILSLLTTDEQDSDNCQCLLWKDTTLDVSCFGSIFALSDARSEALLNCCQGQARLTLSVPAPKPRLYVLS